MYIFDKDGNQLINAEPTTFKEQKLKEPNLQLWQKFNGTHVREIN